MDKQQSQGFEIRGEPVEPTKAVTVLTIRDFPKELHKAARIRAIDDEKTLLQLVVEAIQNYLAAPQTRLPV